jgi:hypothetical protein
MSPAFEAAPLGHDFVNTSYGPFNPESKQWRLGINEPWIRYFRCQSIETPITYKADCVGINSNGQTRFGRSDQRHGAKQEPTRKIDAQEDEATVVW